MRALFVFLAVLHFFLCTAWAQLRSTAISGKIVDPTGAAIQGAKIEFRTENGVAVASSDEQGQFRIEGSAAGGTIGVSFPGLATVTREIRPRASTENLQIVMTPAPNLQRRRVRANAGDAIPDTPTSQYNISADAI